MGDPKAPLQAFIIDPNAGLATVQVTIADGEFESLAIVPIPTTLFILGSGLI